jgi:DsbC/DsbD-like thiol-disulfide interchange protein
MPTNTRLEFNLLLRLRFRTAAARVLLATFAMPCGGAASRRIQFYWGLIACRRWAMIPIGLRLAGAALLALGLTPLPAHAADASAWDGDARSAVRLLAGGPAPRGALQAGVEIKLANGWKTYWRYPGDSGVPPHFDFSRSSNVKTATVLWPAPRRFADGSGQSIGYDSNVIFPVRVVAKDPAQPMTLRLKLDYAICERMCVPVESEVELPLAPAHATSVNEAALAAADARVPKPAALGGQGVLAIQGLHREHGNPARVIVDVKGPEGTDLFAEGPDAKWALPLPKPIAGGASGTQRFAIDLEGLPPGRDARGAELTLTAVAAGSGIEVKAALD